MSLRPTCSPGGDPGHRSDKIGMDMETTSPAPVTDDERYRTARRVESARLVAFNGSQQIGVAPQPWLVALVLRLDVIVTRGLPTMGVDFAGNLYANPEFVAGTPMDQLAAVVRHEAHHLLRDHARRARDLVGDHPGRAKVWNLAADAAINPDLTGLPDGAITPAVLGLPDGMSEEQMFQALMDRAERSQGNGDGSSDSGDGQPGDGDPSDSGAGQPGGSSSDGIRRPWETADGGITPEAMTEIRRVVAEAAVAHGKQHGHGTAGLPIAWAESLLAPPKIRWQDRLYATVRASVDARAGHSHRTWCTTSSRSQHGILLPTSCSYPIRVTVIVDTSGSMVDDMLVVLSEIRGLLDTPDVEHVRVIQVDAAVTGDDRVAQIGDLNLSGGGGTDLRPAITAASEEDPPAHLVVIATDCETPWPTRNEFDASADVVVVAVRTKATAPEWWTRVDVD